MARTLKDFPQTVKRGGEDYTIFYAWTYRNPDGSTCFYKVRYNGQPKPDKPKLPKTFLYFYEDDTGKLIAKMPKVDPVPPLKADVLHDHPDIDYLMVEGEKSATCKTARALEEKGYVVTTTTGAMKKADIHYFALSGNRLGYYLPDKDVPGYTKALEVLDHIRGIKILRPLPEWGTGESIDDYDYAPMELIAYMDSSDPMTRDELLTLCGRENEIHKPDDVRPPFVFMGFDDKAYYFIPQNQNIPIRIVRGNQSLKNNLEEIAPFAFWFSHFNKDSEDGERLDYGKAFDYVRTGSYRRGIFDSSTLLGVGPHIDGNRQIIINTGRSLQFYGNGEIDYNDYTGDLAFVRSRYRFEIKGEPWGRAERACFIEQVNTFGFESALQKICLVGWCVTAPFSSLFEFRPHIWMTARKGTGKSRLMNGILKPAIGPFLTETEGKTSEAAVRQTIGRDSRPVLIDEFDANNKADQIIINGILGLARSAYGGGEIIKGTPSHDPIIFQTKMTFCFASVKTYFTNAADTSRIVTINMKESPGRMTELPKMSGMRKMMFDRLYELLENIGLVKKQILKLGLDERTGDTYAPLVAGYWMIISDNRFLEDEKFNARMVAILKTIGADVKQEDEDSVLDHILSYTVRIDPSTSMTVAEMLMEFAGAPGLSDQQLKYDGNLRRMGIRRFRKIAGGREREVLAIAANHQEIRKIMEDTAFFEYREVLSRHKAFIPGDSHKFPTVYMAGKTDRVILLDWETVARDYLAKPEDDGIPF